MSATKDKGIIMMDNSELRYQLEATAVLLDNQIKEVEAEAVRMQTFTTVLRTMNGEYLLSPLLVARAQVLHALAMLKADTSQPNPPVIINVKQPMNEAEAEVLRETLSKYVGEPQQPNAPRYPRPH